MVSQEFTGNDSKSLRLSQTDKKTESFLGLCFIRHKMSYRDCGWLFPQGSLLHYSQILFSTIITALI